MFVTPEIVVKHFNTEKFFFRTKLKTFIVFNKKQKEYPYFIALKCRKVYKGKITLEQSTVVLPLGKMFYILNDGIKCGYLFQYPRYNLKTFTQLWTISKTEDNTLDEVPILNYQSDYISVFSTNTQQSVIVKNCLVNIKVH